jgi:hypothetical protein
MGFPIKFNWVLQTNQNSSLEVGKTYNFSKSGNRNFPLGTPIDLINSKREAIAKISVLEFTNKKDETTGKFRVLKIYEGEEKTILTAYWIENQ